MVQANSANPGVVVAHLNAIHQATGANVVLQDYPLASGVSISTEALITVVQACGFVTAVKAEAPPTSVAIAQLTAALDVSVFGGLGGQGLLDELMAGAAGAMTGFSYPEALIACVRAWQTDGYEAARDALLPYLPLINFEQQARIALRDPQGMPAPARTHRRRRRPGPGRAVPGGPPDRAAHAPGRGRRGPWAEPGRRRSPRRGGLMDLGISGKTAFVAASTGGLGLADRPRPRRRRRAASPSPAGAKSAPRRSLPN